MKNGIENGYYHEITPSGFGIAIKAGEVLFSDNSPFQKVEVFETDSQLGRVLTLDDLMMTTEGDEYHYHEMIAHIPMMQHPCPKSVLVIGGGDGGTIREVMKHKTVEKAVLCEIDGMVIEACKKYLPTISCELDNPKVEILVQDAIEYIKDKKDEFDIILIDSTDPMGPGEGLFTEEFYTNVKNSLKKGGIIAAQSIGVVKELSAIHGAKDEDIYSRTNVNGGAIALGHPVGASGARILVTLTYLLKHNENYNCGLASLCIGGGMGTAIIIKKV